jgi:hypothetical protein
MLYVTKLPAHLFVFLMLGTSGYLSHMPSHERVILVSNVDRVAHSKVLRGKEAGWRLFTTMKRRLFW